MWNGEPLPDSNRRNSRLTAPVVPDAAVLAVSGNSGTFEYRSCEEAKVLAGGIKLQLPCRSDHGMLMKDHDLHPPFACKTLQPLAQVNFLRDEQFVAESTNSSKCLCIAENERSRKPAARAADPIPDNNGACRQRLFPIQLHRHAAGKTSAGNNLLRHIAKQFPVRLRIRIHKDEPVAGSCGCAGVSRASDLIDGFEHD